VSLTDFFFRDGRTRAVRFGFFVFCFAVFKMNGQFEEPFGALAEDTAVNYYESMKRIEKLG
jgi:hypothetical protein